MARLALGADAMVAVGLEAMEELSGFRDQMAPERFARTQSIAVDRLVRARLGLPTLVFT